ncbi:MAG TPA: beta-galactosidase [Candidatus Limnocylindrales bacterium]
MYLYGGDYNPEQWPESTRSQDLELMREARVNLVTVGVFSWSLLEPAPGVFEFDWLDRVLDDLHAAGIGVCLATPTASPPPWFTLAHPDALPQTREGVRLVHGSRDTYCVNAPAYREACRDIATRLAQRYARHPALRFWHVHNEYGTWCFCDHCAVAFREWLLLRYSEIAALNEAWTAAFWSQRYGRWEEILPPRATQYLRNPAHELDYRRFLSDAMLAAYREQRDIIRAAGGSAQVTTNFVLGQWVPVDHARWAGEVDVVAIDSYPSTVDSALAESAFAADAARGWAGGGEWLLMEHPPRDSPLMERIALAHIERGSKGALFFQWRASRGGAEQWHPALVPHGGRDTAMFRHTVALGSRLACLPPREALARARVAVWYDEQCSWALQATHHLPVKLDYEAEVLRCHSTLEAAGHRVDVIPPGTPLTDYETVVVPAAYMLSDASVAALRDYPGRLLVGQWSGTVDEHLRVRHCLPFDRTLQASYDLPLGEREEQ